MHPDGPDPKVIASAAALLQGGGLVAFPTETVYGLGADALDPDAVRRLFAAKGRPADNPLIVHVATRRQVDQVARDIPALAQALMDRFWPGPLALVLPRRPGVPDETTAGLETVAVRMPDHTVARALIEATGRPVAAPSANRSGSPSPTTALHVLADLEGRIDAVVDAGPCRVGVESTVVLVVGNQATVLRLGAVTEAMLRNVVPSVTVAASAHGAAASADETVRSPGLKHRHYAPKAPVRLFEGPERVAALSAAREEGVARGERVGMVVTEESGLHGPDVVPIASRKDPEAYARALYGTLRHLDGLGVDRILVEGIATDGIGAAVMDRLRRAAAQEKTTG